MADNPISINLPKDLPENWTESDTVAADGVQAGLTKQHGLNYLMGQVNDTQEAMSEIGEAITHIASLDPQTKQAKPSEFPTLAFQKPTQSLPDAGDITLDDTMPVYVESSGRSEQISLQEIKTIVEAPDYEIYALTNTNPGNVVTCTQGETVLQGQGPTLFKLPTDGEWIVTASYEDGQATVTVVVDTLMRYTVDVRILLSIWVSKDPDKMEYYTDETYDPTGIEITATFRDGSRALVTDICTYEIVSIPATPSVRLIRYSCTIAGNTQTINLITDVKWDTIPNTPREYSTLTYNGAIQSPIWEGFDPLQLTVSGIQHGTDAGDYTAYFTPTQRYQWYDGTRTAKEAVWTIKKANRLLVLTPSFLFMDIMSTQQRVSFRYESATLPTYSVPTPDIVNVILSRDGGGMDVTAVATGRTTIRITIAEDINYNAVFQDCPVEVELYAEKLNDNTWAQIRAAVTNDVASSLWAVGDTKDVELNGTIADTQFNSFVCSAFIIGFDHNIPNELYKGIHFQIGKLGTQNIALCSSSYPAPGRGFVMNDTAISSFGWEDSQMRNHILGAANKSTPQVGTLMAALPEDLRQHLSYVRKWDTSYPSPTVTATYNFLFLLSSYELGLLHFYSPAPERPFQQYYPYYLGGNSKAAYRHSSPTEPIAWWLRTQAVVSIGTPPIWLEGSFIGLDLPASAFILEVMRADTNAGIRPCFCIGEALSPGLTEEPIMVGSLTYNGYIQSPTWMYYDTSMLTIGGVQSSTNAGDYVATFTPKEGYKWPSGTTETRLVTWTIQKSPRTLTITPTEVALTPGNGWIGYTRLTYPGTALPTVTSDNPSVVSAYWVPGSGDIELKALNNAYAAQAKIIVEIPEEDNYLATSTHSFTVTVTPNPISSVLANNTWAQIKAAVVDDVASNFWAVGDTKDVELNGTIADTQFNSFVCSAFIIGFDHNIPNELHKGIHFQMGKLGTKNIALCSSSYDTQNGGFEMNSTATDDYGWSACRMRSHILGATNDPAAPQVGTLMAAVPEDLRQHLSYVPKWDANLPSASALMTSNYFFLLSTHECISPDHGIPAVEYTLQERYAYYSSGNTIISYRHDSPLKAIDWWLRSQYVYLPDGTRAKTAFCCVLASGDFGIWTANTNRGIRPCFCIGEKVAPGVTEEP